MADEDKSLKIGIEIGANTAGATQADAALKGVKESASGLSGATGDLAGATGKSNEALGEAEKGSEKLHLSHRGLHQSVRQLSAAFPELGMLAHASMFGIVGVVLLAAEAMHKLKEAAEAWEKIAEDSFNAAEESANDFAKTNAKVAADAGKDWEDFYHKLSEAGNLEDPLGKSFEALKLKIEAVSAAQKEVLANQKKLALEEIEHGDGTPEEKRAAKEGVEDRFAGYGKTIEESKEKEILQNQKNELATRAAVNNRLRDEAFEAESKSHDLDARKETLERKIGNLEKEKAQAKKDVEPGGKAEKEFRSQIAGIEVGFQNGAISAEEKKEAEEKSRAAFEQRRKVAEGLDETYLALLDERNKIEAQSNALKRDAQKKLSLAEANEKKITENQFDLAAKQNARDAADAITNPPVAPPRSVPRPVIDPNARRKQLEAGIEKDQTMIEHSTGATREAWQKQLASAQKELAALGPALKNHADVVMQVMASTISQLNANTQRIEKLEGAIRTNAAR